jgi:hypothetical protein
LAVNRCLGRRAHNPAAVAAAPHLRYSTDAPPPATLDRSALNFQPTLAGNDQYPSCTVAGLLNGALAAEALSTGGGLAFDPMAWMPFYAAVAGCDATPAAIGASGGLNMLDVLRYQGRNGFNIGAVAPLTGSFGVVPTDRLSLARVTAGLGFAYLGVDLAQSDMTSAPGAAWGLATPDPTLGHCLLLWDYTGLGDDDLVGLATWGQFQECSWIGLEARLQDQEAYAIFDPATAPASVNTVAFASEYAAWLTS